MGFQFVDLEIVGVDIFVNEFTPEMTALILTRCEIDRDAFKVIGELAEIEVLYFEGTNIIDEDIPALLPLEKLWLISLSNTQVSDAAKEKLLKKFPNLDLTDD